jgi:hypothetical protein
MLQKILCPGKNCSKRKHIFKISLWRKSLAVRFDNPILNRFLVPKDCSKIPALGFLSWKYEKDLLINIMEMLTIIIQYKHKGHHLEHPGPPPGLLGQWARLDITHISVHVAN